MRWRMVLAVRARYDGRKQNPWNDIECGDHYVRAMSAWSLLEAASGYGSDAGAAEMAFAPALSPDDFRAPFFARDGWGTFAQKTVDGVQTCTLQVAWGELSLQTLRLCASGAATSINVHLDGEAIHSTTMQSGNDVRIVPEEKLTLRAGQRLEVTARGTDVMQAASMP